MLEKYSPVMAYETRAPLCLLFCAVLGAGFSCWGPRISIPLCSLVFALTRQVPASETVQKPVSTGQAEKVKIWTAD